MFDELKDGEARYMQLAIGQEFILYDSLIADYLEGNQSEIRAHGLLYVGDTTVDFHKELSHYLEIHDIQASIDIKKGFTPQYVYSTHGIEERLCAALFLVAETNIKGLFVILASEDVLQNALF